VKVLEVQMHFIVEIGREVMAGGRSMGRRSRTCLRQHEHQSNSAWLHGVLPRCFDLISQPTLRRDFEVFVITNRRLKGYFDIAANQGSAAAAAPSTASLVGKLVCE